MSVRVITGDCREILPTLLQAESVQCVVTSPPYFGLRDYGVDNQIGLEPSPDEYVAELVAVFRQVRRVLKNDGTLWLNLGDTYQNSKGLSGGVDPKQPARRHGLRPQDGPPPAGLKPKDLIGIPWRVAFALQADGWWLRQDIIWSKPNPMPESVTDRCTKSHEYVFLLAKGARYYFDGDAIAEPAAYVGLTGQDQSGFKDPRKYKGKHGNLRATFRGGGAYTHDQAKANNSAVVSGDGETRPRPASETRNRRSVWNVATSPFAEAHFATFPPALIEPCILAGCPEGGTVLDPFGGAGTTGLVADRHGRHAILIELNPEYAAMAARRLRGDAPLFTEVAGATA